MIDKQSFTSTVTSLQQALRAYQDMDDPTTIESVAERLQRLNYAPPVHLSQKIFLHITSTEMGDEINHLSQIEDVDFENTLQKISILVYYFKEITELRRGTAEAWDEVDELYVHD